MEDRELKQHLLETCPIRPGQEERAWAALRVRLSGEARSYQSWLYYPTWRGAVLAVLVVGALPLVSGLFYFAQSRTLATADSQAAGVYATSFYSKPAQAQVVWLNGLDPATDRPTFLDTTGVINGPKDNPAPAGDPNSL